MALTPEQIAALTAELKELAEAGANVNQLRNNLSNLSNTDLSDLLSSLGAITEANEDLAKTIRAQTASNNASISSLEARTRALQDEAAAYEGTTQELDKKIKAQKAALELAREEQKVNGGSFDNIKAQEAALKSLTDQKQELTEKAQELKTIQQQLVTSGSNLQNLFLLLIRQARVCSIPLSLLRAD